MYKIIKWKHTQTQILLQKRTIEATGNSII